MTMFHILVCACDRYELEAESEEAALKMIKDCHYGTFRNLQREFNRVDFFTKFESEGVADDTYGEAI